MGVDTINKLIWFKNITTNPVYNTGGDADPARGLAASRSAEGAAAKLDRRKDPSRRHLRMVVSGLETGDQVVVDGVDSLYDGAKVVVVASADETAAARGQPPQTQGRNRGQGGGGHGRGQGGGRGGSKAAPKAGAPSEE
jgi:hypothetical protein